MTLASFRITPLVLAASLVACTGDNSTASRENAPPTAAPATNNAGDAPAVGAGANRCPLSAEQVSAAVGAQVKGPDVSCSFFPVDEARVRPSAAYVNQVSIACSGNVPAENGYTEKLDGLGQPAYIAEQADGWWVLVCRGNHPFEIRVDAPGQDVARNAAITLAREVMTMRPSG